MKYILQKLKMDGFKTTLNIHLQKENSEIIGRMLHGSCCERKIAGERHTVQILCEKIWFKLPPCSRKDFIEMRMVR